MFKYSSFYEWTDRKMRQIDCQFSTHCPEPGTEGPDDFKVQGVKRVLPIVNHGEFVDFAMVINVNISDHNYIISIPVNSGLTSTPESSIHSVKLYFLTYPDQTNPSALSPFLLELTSPCN